MNRFDLQAKDRGDRVEIGELHVTTVFEAAVETVVRIGN